MTAAQSSARSSNHVRIRVPATTANFGPGFDCMGMALDIFDTVTVSLGQSDAAVSGADELQADYRELVALAARKLYEKAGQKAPELSVACEHCIPIGRGLGSSAAAIAAGVIGANELAGRPLDQEGLVRLAAAIEGHPDNSTPCVLGGFQLCVSKIPQGQNEDDLIHVAVPVPDGLKAVLFIPDFPMPTHETRKLLPEQLSRTDVVFQTARAALIVAALSGGRLEHLQVATQDRLHQPARGTVFPGMWKLFDAAMDAGARCAYLSGGGPTVLALCENGEERVRAAMEQAARSAGIGGETRIARPTLQGAHIVE